MMIGCVVRRFLCLLCCCGVFACSGDAFSPPAKGDSNSSEPRDTSVDAQLGIGNPCETSDDCRDGILCSSVTNTCEYPGSPGTLPVDSSCVNNTDCAAGLVCSASATCQVVGSPGTAVAGDTCEENSDCVFGLYCQNGRCVGVQMVIWNGAECEDTPEAPEAFESYFDIRRESGEFYRLPFPNDARRVQGRIDMSGHPDPGVLVEELGNPVGAYIDYIENELDGFGLNSLIYFRFNQTPDWDSVVLGESVYIMNIDPSSPGYGVKAWTGYSGSSGRGKYICQNWMALRPSLGYPLDPGTVYAAVITTALTDLNGSALRRSAEFNSMLAFARPSDTDIRSAWDAYAPLRNFIVDTGTSPGDIAAATVFTTQSSPDVLPRIRQQVRRETMPVLVGDMDRDTSDTSFVLYSGRITVPFYQEGERPFRETGGQFVYDSGGFPVLQDEEGVTFALSVPTGEAPVMGWPVFLYAHGTGGSEMSFVQEDVASVMAEKGAAVISLLQVQHGERRGVSEVEAQLDMYDEGALFYNFVNPRAAVGNNLQAAADYFQMVRLLEEFVTVTEEPIVFDTDRMYFVGHSQGTQGQFLAAVHEPLVRGILLSGAGGFLMETLLGKKEPVDLSMGIRMLLMEPTVDSRHPVLNLIQAAMEQVDPVNHGRAVYRNEWPGQTYPHRDVYMSFGIGDSYTPEMTQSALVKTFRLAIDVIDGHEPPGFFRDIAVSGTPEYLYPVTETGRFSGQSVTTVAVQYEPDGYDGHFVFFRNARARSQWAHFVETMLDETLPTELISGL